MVGVEPSEIGGSGVSAFSSREKQKQSKDFTTRYQTAQMSEGPGKLRYIRILLSAFCFDHSPHEVYHSLLFPVRRPVSGAPDAD